jgi:hypothetical protein
MKLKYQFKGMASIKIPIESALASGATNLWKHTYDDQ